MSSGTKIGLLIVAILCGIGGFFIYQKIQDKSQFVEAPPPTDEGEGDPQLADDEQPDGHTHGGEFDEEFGDPNIKPAGGQVADAPRPQQQQRRYGPPGGGSGRGTKFEDLDFEEAPAPDGQSEPEADPFENAGSSRRRSGGRHDHGHPLDKSKIETFDNDLEEIDVANNEKNAEPVIERDEFESLDDDERPHRRDRRFGGQFGNNDGGRGRSSGPWGRDESLDSKDDPFQNQPATLGGENATAGKEARRDSDFEDFSVHDGRDFDAAQGGTASSSSSTEVKPQQNHGVTINGNGRRSRWGNHYRGEAPLPEDDAPDTLDADVLEPIPADAQSASHTPTTSPGDTSHLGDAPSPFQGGNDHQHQNGQGGGRFGMMKDMQWYVVEQNDSFWSIAKKVYGAGSYFNALAAFNQERIPDPQKMRPGMKVMVPPKPILEQRFPHLIATLATSSPSVQQSGFHTTGHGHHHHHHGDVQPAGFFVNAQGQPNYRVGKSDTLSDIAKTHLGRASRWSQIYEMNRQFLQTPHSLQVGMVLHLPADASNVALATERRFTR